MKIRWHSGHSLSLRGNKYRVIVGLPHDTQVKQLKIKEGELVILPYPLATYSEEVQTSLQNSQAFIIDGAGEYSYGGVTIRGISVHRQAGNRMNLFSLSVEDIVFVSLFDLDRELEQKEFDLIGNTDILAVPIGGADVLTYKKAVKVAHKVEPRMIIPLKYQSPHDPEQAPVDDFVKEYGLEPQPEEERTVKKSSLSIEQTDLVVLTVN